MAGAGHGWAGVPSKRCPSGGWPRWNRPEDDLPLLSLRAGCPAGKRPWKLVRLLEIPTSGKLSVYTQSASAVDDMDPKFKNQNRFFMFHQTLASNLLSAMLDVSDRVQVGFDPKKPDHNCMITRTTSGSLWHYWPDPLQLRKDRTFASSAAFKSGDAADSQ